MDTYILLSVCVVYAKTECIRMTERVFFCQSFQGFVSIINTLSGLMPLNWLFLPKSSEKIRKSSSFQFSIKISFEKLMKRSNVDLTSATLFECNFSIEWNLWNNTFLSKLLELSFEIEWKSSSSNGRQQSPPKLS